MYRFPQPVRFRIIKLYFMKKHPFSFILLFFSLFIICPAKAQNVAINSTGASPDTSAMLDLQSTNKGLLIPRLSLTALTDAATIPLPAHSLLVYNTNTSLSGGEGYYYNSGTTASPSWVKLTSTNSGWQLTGNSGTTPGTNFVGTTDSIDLVFKTKNAERMRISGSGNVGIGSSTFDATNPEKLKIDAGTSTSENAVAAYGNLNDFFQYNIQNKSTGTNAQSGYAATADNGTQTTGFAWLGINNSGFNFPSPYNIGHAGDVNYLGIGKNMYIANGSAGKNLFFVTGGTADSNTRMTIDPYGRVGIGTTAPTAYLHIKAGTATAGNAPLKLSAGPLLTAPEPGAIEYKGHTFYATTYLVRRSIMLAQDVVITPVTVANTSTETTIYTTTMAANYPTVGKTMHIRLWGQFSTENTSAIFTINVYMGGTLILTNTSVSQSATNRTFDIDITATVRSIGTSGSIIGYGKVQQDNMAPNMAISNLTTVNTTTSNDLVVKIKWNNADDLNTLTLQGGDNECIDPNN